MEVHSCHPLLGFHIYGNPVQISGIGRTLVHCTVGKWSESRARTLLYSKVIQGAKGPIQKSGIYLGST